MTGFDYRESELPDVTQVTDGLFCCGPFTFDRAQYDVGRAREAALSALAWHGYLTRMSGTALFAARVLSFGRGDSETPRLVYVATYSQYADALLDEVHRRLVDGRIASVSADYRSACEAYPETAHRILVRRAGLPGEGFMEQLQ